FCLYRLFKAAGQELVFLQAARTHAVFTAPTVTISEAIDGQCRSSNSVEIPFHAFARGHGEEGILCGVPGAADSPSCGVRPRRGYRSTCQSRSPGPLGQIWPECCGRESTGSK